MKKAVIAAVLLLWGTALYTTVSTSVQKPLEYKKYLSEAKKFEKKEIYYDAILSYQKALEYRPDNWELYLNIADNCLLLGNEEAFEENCMTAIQTGEENEEAVFKLVDYYLETERRQNAISLLRSQASGKKNPEAIEAKLMSLAGEYQFMSGEFDGITDTCGNYMKVKAGEVYGILDASGNQVIYPEYEKIGMFGNNGFAPVQKEGQCYYIDTGNYKRRVPDEYYEELGIVNQGILPAKKDGKWGYLNEDFQPVTEFVYEDATPVLNSMAAVKKDGKWAVVGENFKQLTEFGFDEVVRDDWGFCSRNGVVFGKTGQEYRLINQEGMQIGGTYEEARAFVSEQPAAVKKDGKWLFVSSDGKETGGFSFEDAKSFSTIGYAPVRQNGKWGYIKMNGDFVIAPEFDSAKAFNSYGIAPVKKSGVWSLIKLDIY